MVLEGQITIDFETTFHERNRRDRRMLPFERPESPDFAGGLLAPRTVQKVHSRANSCLKFAQVEARVFRL